jgi:predicted Zn finger-like uncharacterized protein
LILTCDKCETRFRLDESRLPAKGARVRCSRCKHSFFVRAPGVADEQAIDAVAAEAARSATSPKPEIAWDLDESADPGATMQREAPKLPARDLAASQRERTSGPLAEPPGDLDESDWRFEDEVPELGDSGASLDLPNGEAPAPLADGDPNESSFAVLGDPESWDLLSSSDSGIQTGSGPTPIGGLALPPARPARATAPPVEAAPTVAPPAPAREPRVEPAAIVATEPGRGARTAGWLATAALAAVVLAGGLRAPAPPTEAAAPVSIGAMSVENLRARVVDNVWAGPLWVVSGELHNPGGEPQRLDAAVGVVLLDRAGTRIEGSLALAQPALDATRLRVDAPEALHDDESGAAAALATRVLAPDARVPIEAVLPAAPPEAVRFAIEPQPAPRS